MLIGGLLFIIITFLLIFCFIKYKTYKINKEAKDTVNDFLKTINTNKEKDKDKIDDNDNQNLNTKIYYHHYLVIGAIEIPSLNLTYPIIEDIDEESMKKGIVLLYGDKLNSIGNIVLAGHAYLKNTYFSNISNLKKNDQIIITDSSGNRITYYVYKTFLADKNDASFYKRETNDLREITLSTCTVNNDNQRHIVLAKEKSE